MSSEASNKWLNIGELFTSMEPRTNNTLDRFDVRPLGQQME
jgi:hypothetical protein